MKYSGCFYLFLFLSVLASPVPSFGDDYEIRSVEDIQSMTLREDGKYDVVCKNGTKEVVTVQQISENAVCGGGAPTPGPEVVAVFSRPQGNFFVLCKNKSWEVGTAQQIQQGKVCPGIVEPFEFTSVRPGAFKMGSPEGEPGHDSDEKLRDVTLTKSFQIQTTEVTQSVWEMVMGNNPSYFKGANLPVETISWNDVQDFIKKLNALYAGGGYNYRLPTEAEWEYAARGGNMVSSSEMQNAYSFGNDVNKLGDFAWFSGNSGDKTQTVGIRGKNALGLYDMHGNVWEWAQDLYIADTSSLSTTDPLNESSGSARVVRGGSWYNSAQYHLHSASRHGVSPSARDKGIGFRLVRTPK